MQYFIILPVALQAFSGSALAQCPTSESLTQGIRFTLSSGETETFRTQADSIVSSVFEGPDLPPSRALLGQGLYLLEIVDLRDGQPDPATRSTYSFPVKPSEMPLPQPGGTWSTRVAVLDMGELRSEDQTYGFGATTSASFGACAYDVIPVRITYPGGEGNATDLLHYLPALGLSYLAASTYDGQTDSYQYVSITALP